MTRKHRGDTAEDLEAGVVSIDDTDLAELARTAREEEQALIVVERVLASRLELARAEAARRHLALGGPPGERRLGPEEVKELLGEEGLPALTRRTDDELRHAVDVLSASLSDARGDLEKVRRTADVVAAEVTRRGT